MEILKPYRARIDAIDDQIVDLLAQRMGIIREVGALKAEKGIHPVLQDRVDEVRERCAARAAEKGVDADMVRDLYDRLIRHCCDLEAEIIKTS
jgi:chorismate mutase-like protein